MSTTPLEPVKAAKLDSYVATRERRVANAYGYPSGALRDNFRRLVAGQTVRVGGRATCGARIDPTWVELCAWKEIVRKARALGLVITETPIKHGNGWATKAGGFWDENDYTLEIP